MLKEPKFRVEKYLLSWRSTHLLVVSNTWLQLQLFSCTESVRGIKVLSTHFLFFLLNFCLTNSGPVATRLERVCVRLCARVRVCMSRCWLARPWQLQTEMGPNWRKGEWALVQLLLKAKFPQHHNLLQSAPCSAKTTTTAQNIRSRRPAYNKTKPHLWFGPVKAFKHLFTTS